MLAEETFLPPRPVEPADPQARVREQLAADESAAEGEGWAMSYVYDRATDRSELHVLDATDITAGPVATVHLPPEVAARISGALLVAPADPERRGVLADFAPVPYQALSYRSIVVAGSNDPFCPVRLSGAYARAWGSEFVRLNDAGHINV